MSDSNNKLNSNLIFDSTTDYLCCKSDGIKMGFEYEWKRLFHEKEEFEYFFNVTLPIALRKEEVFGHVLIRCDNSLIVKNFIDELTDILSLEKGIKSLTIHNTTRDGDLTAFFTSLEPGDVVKICINDKLKEEIIDLLYEILINFSMTITIGKGHMIREVTFDLPPFSVLFVTKEHEPLPYKLLQAIETKIEPSFSEEELLKIKICHYSNLLDLELTSDTLDLLVEYLKDKHIKTVIRYLSDYLLLHQDIVQPLDRTHMKDILMRYNRK